VGPMPAVGVTMILRPVTAGIAHRATNENVRWVDIHFQVLVSHASGMDGI